jgi:hypothetical protein
MVVNALNAASFAMKVTTGIYALVNVKDAVRYVKNNMIGTVANVNVVVKSVMMGMIGMAASVNVAEKRAMRGMIGNLLMENA